MLQKAVCFVSQSCLHREAAVVAVEELATSCCVHFLQGLDAKLEYILGSITGHNG